MQGEPFEFGRYNDVLCNSSAPINCSMSLSLGHRGNWQTWQTSPGVHLVWFLFGKGNFSALRQGELHRHLRCLHQHHLCKTLLQEGLHWLLWHLHWICLRQHFDMRGFTIIFDVYLSTASANTLAWGASRHHIFSVYTNIVFTKHFGRRFHHHLWRTTTTRFRQHLGWRGFAHYNGSRAFVDTFDMNTYNDLPSSRSLRGSPTTLARTSTSTTAYVDYTKHD